MPPIFLTPASISYLSQSLLALLITCYLGVRFFAVKPLRASLQDLLLLLFFVFTTLFSFSFFWEVSLLPSERLTAVYLENVLLGFLLIALAQFAYFYPEPVAHQALERKWVLGLTSLYTLWEIGIAVQRFGLLQQGLVEYRPEALDFLPAVELFWIIVVFVRKTLRNWHKPFSRRFALVFSIPLFLAIVNVLRTFEVIATPFYHISMSIGILFTLFFFTITYLSAKAETTSLMVRFSGAILTGVLAVFGGVAWLVTPTYAAEYQPLLKDQRTLQFTPNAQGGYRVAELPLQFEHDWGENLQLKNTTLVSPPAPALAFDFPFYGQLYRSVFISDDGALSFGGALDYKNLEYHFGNVPTIFAMMLDLNPESNPSGGVFLRRENDQLTITFARVLAFTHPEDMYTFQIRLHASGQFEINYNGLPAAPHYFANDRPFATPWALGVKPAQAPRAQGSYHRLPIETDAQGHIQDEYRAFRQFLHNFLAPLAWAVVFGSLFFLMGIPLSIYFSVTRPLSALLHGVAQLNQGQRELPVPVQFNDEIGFLTQSFNNMAGELNSLINTLELRVADRTAIVLAANEQLRKLSIAVEQSPSSIIITDLDANIEYTNQSFTRSTGYAFAEVRGLNPRFLKSQQTPPQQYLEMWATLTAGETWRGELLNCKKDGQLFWESTIIAPIRDQAGRITHYVAVKEDITLRKQAEQELSRLAITDPLTGLYNRRHFFANAEVLYKRSKTPPDELSALMLDIDHFKQVNDTFGHQAGDAVLREVAAIIQNNLRPTDLLARYGGEEFAVLLPRTAQTEAVWIAQRLLAAIHNLSIPAYGPDLRVTLSIGVAHMHETIATLDELLSHADQAMYLAKHQGRDRWMVWQPAAPGPVNPPDAPGHS